MTRRDPLLCHLDPPPDTAEPSPRSRLALVALFAGALGLVLGYAAHIAKVQLAGPAPEPSRVTAADPRASVVESIKAYSLRTGTRPIFIRDAYCFLMPEPGEVAGR